MVSVASTVFIAIFVFLVTLAEAMCMGLSFVVLCNLIKETSSGNGAKYRHWLQIVIKDCLLVLFCNLINIVVTLSSDEWVLSKPICWITGYLHVTLILVGITHLCSLFLYQYISTVITPREHPDFRQCVVLWSISWASPALMAFLLPVTTASDIQFTPSRLCCTFNREGNVNHDTSLLVLVATSFGFACVFCAVLILKIHQAIKTEQSMGSHVRHISLFGNQVSESRRNETELCSTGCQREDFKMICLLALANFIILVPYTFLLFALSATRGNFGEGFSKFCILILRLLPLIDFFVLLRDLVFKSRILRCLESLDYTCKFFYLRNFVGSSQITPTSVIRVSPEESNYDLN